MTPLLCTPLTQGSLGVTPLLCTPLTQGSLGVTPLLCTLWPYWLVSVSLLHVDELKGILSCLQLVFNKLHNQLLELRCVA